MGQSRKQAAHRPRRIIFNNDGDDVVYYSKPAPTAEEVLKLRTTPLLGSQVDTIFYSTTQGFPLFSHNTKVGEVFTCKEAMFADNVAGDLIAQGTDALQIMVDFCKKNRMELFWSMRMNDIHDAWGGDYSPYFFPKFKKDHPEYIMGTENDKPKHGGWTSVDYGEPEVREVAFGLIQEVCQNYDVDGIEMDFFRHPMFFRRASRGLPLGQEELDVMTGLVRRVRETADWQGKKRGRPMLVAARLPDSVQYCRGIGIDLETWLAEDLLDILVVTGYFQLSPWEHSVALGHGYDVPVYACLSESRIPGEAGKARNSDESYRARAMNVWNAGADGVYMFNLFDPHSPLWWELGDPETLARLDKVYFPTLRGGADSAEFWLEGGAKLFNVPLLLPQDPLKLTPGTAESVSITVGDDPGRGMQPKVDLRLQVGNLADAEAIVAAANGMALAAGVLSGEWLEYAVEPHLVKRGENRLEITVRAGYDTPAMLRDVQLWVRYQTSS